jgi:hypothetical protein
MSLLLREQLLAEMAKVELSERLVVTPLLDEKQVGPGKR